MFTILMTEQNIKKKVTICVIIVYLGVFSELKLSGLFCSCVVGPISGVCTHPSFIWCIGKAVLHDYDILWISLIISVQTNLNLSAKYSHIICMLALRNIHKIF